MDAQCNACGGRVMSYTRYAAHFRPTATCESCGVRVRVRHYSVLLGVTVVAVAALAAVVFLTHSAVWTATGMALGTLLGFLADFWTFRNLSWDPDEGASPPGSSP